jgi:hypothetical protein
MAHREMDVTLNRTKLYVKFIISPIQYIALSAVVMAISRKCLTI